MGKADYLGSSIPDENYLAKYVNDVINDIDGYDGLPFNNQMYKFSGYDDIYIATCFNGTCSMKKLTLN